MKATRANFVSVYGIATMSEPCLGICRTDCLPCLLERSLEARTRARLGGAPRSVELRPTLLNRLKLGRVRRAVRYPRPTRSQGFLKARSFVYGQGILADPIARAQGPGGTTAGRAPPSPPLLHEGEAKGKALGNLRLGLRLRGYCLDDRLP